MNGLNQAEAIIRGFRIAVEPPNKLTIVKGDTVRMHVSFDYRGPMQDTCMLRCSIGQRGIFGFDEIAYGQTELILPASVDFVPYETSADIDTLPVDVGTNYDIEAKIEEFTSETLVGFDNVIDVIGAAEFANFAITKYEKV